MDKSIKIFFIIFYVFEIAIRIIGNGLKIYVSYYWNLLDLFSVGLNIFYFFLYDYDVKRFIKLDLIPFRILRYNKL
jgi:hypothetical protein